MGRRCVCHALRHRRRQVRTRQGCGGRISDGPGLHLFAGLRPHELLAGQRHVTAVGVSRAGAPVRCSAQEALPLAACREVSRRFVESTSKMMAGVRGGALWPGRISPAVCLQDKHTILSRFNEIPSFYVPGYKNASRQQDGNE